MNNLTDNCQNQDLDLEENKRVVLSVYPEANVQDTPDGQKILLMNHEWPAKIMARGKYEDWVWSRTALQLKRAMIRKLSK